MKIFITGKPASGKSTLVNELIKLAEQKGIAYCGILTPEIRKNGSRIGFKIVALPDKEEEILASTELNYPRVSKYGVNVEGIDKIVSIVEENLGRAKIVFIDEIGKMEMLSERFKSLLSEVLRSDKKVVATLNLALLDEFKNYGKLFFLTRENYEKIKKEILTSISL
jgi:nucleoside-triphosphatase